MAYLIMQIVDTLSVPHASGMNVEEALSNLLGEVVDTGQVYVTLRRQQKNGLLADRDVLSPNGSGHTVTVYSVTEAGRAAMAASARFYAVVAGPLVPLKRGDDTDEPAKKGRSQRTPPRQSARSSS
jgi:DNA-binding PadR family transcriptional regulator